MITADNIREAKAQIDERSDGGGFHPFTEDWLNHVAGDLFNDAEELPRIASDVLGAPWLFSGPDVLMGLLVGVFAERIAERDSE